MLPGQNRSNFAFRFGFSILSTISTAKSGLKFYKDFSERAREESHKKLFGILAREESKHKLKLETLLDDYLAGMGG